MTESAATRPVRPGEELPEPALREFLRASGLLAGADSPISVQQFKNGYSNLTYLLEFEQKQYVLRRPPFAAPKRGHDMGREYKVLEKLHKVFPKAPEAYVYSEDPEILGAPFYIMEKVDGIILSAREAQKRHLAPEAFQTIANAWLDTFVELHNLDYAGAGLESLGRPEGYVERQVTNWSKQYRAAATEDVVSSEQVMAWMQDHQPKTYQHSLIHNDYKYDNLVFTDDSWQEVAAVLDWEMCTLGDPLMDLGTSLGYWTTASDPEFMKLGLPSPTVMEGNPSRSEIVEAYAAKSQRDVSSLVFYYVYGLFKVAVIAQQIYFRYKHGHTTDPRFAELNKASALCCDAAWRAIQKNQIDDLH